MEFNDIPPVNWESQDWGELRSWLAKEVEKEKDKLVGLTEIDAVRRCQGYISCLRNILNLPERYRERAKRLT